MYTITSLLWVLLAICAMVTSEPTPMPSVEPSTVDALVSSTESPSSTTTQSDLDEGSQDQVAILKQINRVNDDGSYTFGYEAADGSFKIETRDHTGNVKGMFGFVDEVGELKRVSYTASNGTGFQTTGSPNVPPLIAPDSGDSTTRISLLPGATTERTGLPVYIYKATTRVPRPEVIQHVTKLRPTPASFSTAPTESEEVTNTNLGRPGFEAELPKKSPTPNYITLTSTPSPVTEGVTRSSFVQVIRPRGYKKVVVTKRPYDYSTIAPSTTTDYYSATYGPDVSDEMMVPGDAQRQVESNSLAETGLITSGTEDSPDVFGGDPTVRPYPSGAYQTLFPPLPQYQRILQEGYSRNSNQLPQNADPRLPPTGPGAAFPNPASIGSYPSLQPRTPIPPTAHDFPRLQDPRFPILNGAQNQAYPPTGQEQKFSFPVANQNQRYPLPPLQPNGLAGQDPRYGMLPGAASNSLRGLPIPGAPGQVLNFPRGGGALEQNLPFPDQGSYQGLTFPSGAGRARLPLPRTPLDYSQSASGRVFPLPENPEATNEPNTQRGSNRRPIGRRPQTLPSNSYNPEQDIPEEDPRVVAPLPPRRPPSARGPSPRGPLPPQTPFDPRGRLPPQSPISPQTPFDPRGPLPPQTSLDPRGTLSPQGGPIAPQSPFDARNPVPPFDPRGPPPARNLGNSDPSQYSPYSFDSQNPNAQAYFMEQIIRMLLSNQARSQAPMRPFSPSGFSNVPPEYFGGRNYDPRYQNYPQDPYQRDPYYPQPPFGPPQSPYRPQTPQQPYPTSQFGPPSSPYAPQAPFDPRYYDPYLDPYGRMQNPRYNPYLNPYYGYNQYSGVGPNLYPGSSPNPYYQNSPEEALLRMFLRSRFSPPVPEQSPQGQNSPAAYSNLESDYPGSQQTNNVFDQGDPGQVFGQRVPLPTESSIVQRSTTPLPRVTPDRTVSRGEASQRSTTFAPREDSTTARPRQSFVQRVLPSQRLRSKGSRNVQIIDDPIADSTTTAKP